MPPVEQLHAENLELKERNAQLEAQVAWLRKQLFGGGKSEKLDRAQLLLKLNELEKLAAAPAKPAQTITYERATPRERPIPAETFAKLPVNEVVELVSEDVKAAPENMRDTAPSDFCRPSMPAMAWSSRDTSCSHQIMRRLRVASPKARS